MLKKFIVLIIFFLFSMNFITFIPKSYAAINNVTFTTIKDTYIYSYSPNGNFGISSNFFIGESESDPEGYYRFLVGFNLSSIHGAAIINATLKLYVVCAISSSYDIEVDRVTGEWEETTVTWNNQPSATTVNNTIVAPPTTTYEYWNINVTQLVIDDFKTSDIVDFKLKLKTETEINDRIWGTTKEHTSNPKPKLVVYYYPAPNPPTLNTPTNNTRVNPSTQVTFTWSYNQGDAGSYYAYQFQLDNNSDFSSPEIDTGKIVSTATSYKTTVPATADVYYWRVKTWDIHNAASWSSVFTLKIGYLYRFVGSYYENGTRNYNNLPITVYFANSQADSFNLNGTVTKLYSEKPVFAVYDLGNTERYWYFKADSENITVYIPQPELDSAFYQFKIQDYAGVLSNNTFLTAERYINGTLQPVTRMAATGSVESVTMLLQVGYGYMLILEGSSFEYNFGLFITNGTTDITLNINSISFSYRTKLAYRYVRVEAFRPSNTTIIVNYEDTLNETIKTELTIKLSNGTTVYTANSTASTVQYQWTNANKTEDYTVTLTIYHSELGTLTYTKALPHLTTYNPPWDLSPLGTFPISSKQIIPLFIVLVFAGLFTRLDHRAGLILVCFIAGILYYFGWLNITYTTFAIALSLAILYALGRRHIE